MLVLYSCGFGGICLHSWRLSDIFMTTQVRRCSKIESCRARGLKSLKPVLFAWNANVCFPSSPIQASRRSGASRHDPFKSTCCSEVSCLPWWQSGSALVFTLHWCYLSDEGKTAKTTAPHGRMCFLSQSIFSFKCSVRHKQCGESFFFIYLLSWENEHRGDSLITDWA